MRQEIYLAEADALRLELLVLKHSQLSERLAEVEQEKRILLADIRARYGAGFDVDLQRRVLFREKDDA